MTESKDDVALIAYHANCIDGFTAAWVTNNFCRALDVRTVLLPVSYDKQSTDKLLQKAEKLKGKLAYIYIVDFSVDLEVLDQLTEKAMRVTVIDHHKTAFEKYCPGIKVQPDSQFFGGVRGAHVILDNAHSGASLCYDYFSGGSGDKDVPWRS